MMTGQILKALLFDLDGTLSDSDPMHLRAFTRILEPHGLTVDHDFYRGRISGRTNAAIFTDLFPDWSPEAIDKVSDEKEALFRSLAKDLAPVKGLSDLLNEADRQGLACAVVTNGPRANLAHMIDVLDLSARLPVRFAREDVERGKPDPMPYLAALNALGVSAEESLAFEDSPAGVTSAVGAGIFTFGVLTAHPAQALLDAGAGGVIVDFSDPVLWRKIQRRE